MAHIKVISKDDADGRLDEIYSDLIRSRGKLADVHMIQSLRPESIVKHMDLYMEIMFSRSELSRAEREMMAVVVSRANACRYCQIHHAEALNHYWKDDEGVNLLREDFTRVEKLSAREKALCHYAHTLTAEPGRSNAENLTQALRQEGIGDAGILDATLVISYFNFVNRMVLGLGVSLEADKGKDYRY